MAATGSHWAPEALQRGNSIGIYRLITHYLRSIWSNLLNLLAYENAYIRPDCTRLHHGNKHWSSHNKDRADDAIGNLYVLLQNRNPYHLLETKHW